MVELQLNALHSGISVDYNNQKQRTCRGCIETVHLGISWDLHATADLGACSAKKTKDAAMSNASVILQSCKGRILWYDLVTLDVSRLVPQPISNYCSTTAWVADSHIGLARQCTNHSALCATFFWNWDVTACAIAVNADMTWAWEIFSWYDATVCLTFLFVLAESVRPEVHRHGIRRWWSGVSGSKSKPQDLTIGTKPFHILPSRQENFKMYFFNEKWSTWSKWKMYFFIFQNLNT